MHTDPKFSASDRRRRLLLGAALLLALLPGAGCTRAWYRRQADSDALKAIREKTTSPHWALDYYSFAMDPRSRFYDPNNPDRPPLPPDDPYSHELMHCVDHKRGYPGWHDNGETPFVDNPAWRAYLEVDENGVMKVTADDAVRLGLLHSRDYRTQLEELYLSALDVSFERFRFDAQGFGGYEVFYTAQGRNRRGNGGQSRSILEANTFSNGPRDIGFQKMFTTGSTLVVGFANSLVWQFSGPDDYMGVTLIDFAFIQPLLRGAGRDRVMERLTVTERNLLGNVRAMEQYRQAFYVQVMMGRSPGQGPSRQGGVFGQGLEGFTGTGGGFGRVSTTSAANAGGGGGGGAGAAEVGGYLGLLQNQQQIRNQEDNVERLRNNLYRLEQFLNELKTRSGEEGLIANILRQDLQVAQARQALVNAESRLLNSRNAYEVSLDNFKGTLGLPPQVCMQVTDNMLDQFQLIDRDSIRQQVELDDVVRSFGDIRLRIASHIETRTEQDPTDPTRGQTVRILQYYPELEQDLADLKVALQPIREVREKMLNQQFPQIAKDLARFEQSIEGRREWIEKLRAKLQEQQNEACALLPLAQFNAEVFNVNRLTNTRDDLRRQWETLENKVRNDYVAHLDERDQSIDQLIENAKNLDPAALFDRLYNDVLYPKRESGASAQDVGDIFVVLPSDILALQLVQARARTESVQLVPVDIRAEQALEVARKYRRDWMNARAALVDSWRLIEFNADNLEGSLNILFSGDVSNVSDNPFRLRSSTGQLRTGVQFDAPVTRLAERNTYRQSLIEYQQARRNYYNFEDTVARGLRGTLRTVAANQLNFELQRLAVLEAARQIDRNEDIRIDQELTGQSAGVTAARDAVSALSDLLDAQNNFMNIWVNYEALRRSLDLDLGTLQLDSEGLWIDPGTIGEDYGKYDPWLWKYNGQECAVDGLEGAEGLDGEELPPEVGRPDGSAPSAGSGSMGDPQSSAIGDLPAPRIRTQRQPLGPQPLSPQPLSPPKPTEAGPLAPVVDPPMTREPPPEAEAIPVPSTADQLGPPETDPATEELQFRPPG